MENGLGPRSPIEPPLPARRSFWVTTAAIWSFYGLMVANQLYFSMRGHGHDWWRILIWQMAGAATWMLLSPVVFALEARFPVEGDRRVSALMTHLGAALSASLLRMLPMTAIALSLDPYRPVPTEPSFAAEYLVQALQWLPPDLLLYGAILIAASVYRIRAQVHRDQLRNVQLEKELASARLRALKLELQPHFLFNTMNSIVSLVRIGEAERAERMLLGLCDLLRSTLDDHRRQLVPLTEEVEITELYLEIQRVRFGDRLDFVWRLEEGVENAEVPALLLQPVIENAIRHAVELGRGRGRIEVTISRRGNDVLIEAEDDGAGTPEPVVPAQGEDEGGPSRGLGLENVRSRLAALYGESWHLGLAPRSEGGTRVTLRFPWRAARGRPEPVRP